MHRPTLPRDTRPACLFALFLVLCVQPGPARAQAVFPLAGAQEVAVGSVFACALLGDASVWCWGNNTAGQLGTGAIGGPELVARPTLVTSGATQIAAGFSHACAVVAGGVQCWGNNISGQLGNGGTTNSSTPVQAIAAGSNIVEVRAGSSHTCARNNVGAVQCWGNNFNGQLGNGATLPGPAVVSSPVPVSGVSLATSLALGNFHSCAIVAGGAPRCWGWNGFGQLGNGSASTGVSTPGPVQTLASGVSGLAAGGQHTCARTGTGAAFCWGDNGQGQLGDGTFIQRLAPVAVSGLANGVTAIAANDSASCAAGSAGASCWGRGSEAQLGFAFPLSVTVPNAVPGLGSGIVELSSRGASVCARLAAGGLQCWGDNFFSQLGRYYLAWRNQPTAVSGTWSAGVLQVAMGYAHACALRANGGVECVGNNASGQLGNGNTTNSMQPVAVQGLTGATAVASGWLHSCAIVAAGAVRCWGRNFEGQLGDGSNTLSNVPVNVTGLSDIVAISAGAYHSCAVSSTGVLSCWGRNSEGQLGLGNTQAANTPQPNPTLASGIATVAAGNFHTCALRTIATGGQAFCWGNNGNGQTGNGGVVSPVTVPAQVGNLAQRAIAAGGFHSCAADDATGAVRCWGNNGSGQLGDNSTTQSTLPVVNGLAGATQLTLGDAYSCARLDTGAVRCWGNNGGGQVGNNNFINALVPVPVAGTLAASQISARLRGACAVRNDNGLSCWGANYWGQFGDGSRQASNLPAVVLQGNPAVLFGDGVEFIGPGPF